MQKLTSEQIKKIELNILLELQEACSRYNLKLYLCGGTLLGAVRHRGFIPWDDDIDVCLPRPDYEKLARLAERGVFPEQFKVLSDENHNYDFPFMKIIDKRTYCRQEYMEEESGDGLWVDVLPVDGLPSDAGKIRRIYRRTGKNRRLLSICLAKKGRGKTRLHQLGKAVVGIYARRAGAETFSNRMIRTAKEYPYETSETVGIITWGLYGEREAMPKRLFQKPAEVSFEGYSFQTMSCWKGYLSHLYGDYMTLPPENKRKVHDMDAWVRDPYRYEEIVSGLAEHRI